MHGSSLIIHLKASEDGTAALQRLFSLEYAGLKQSGFVWSRRVTRGASASFSAAGRKTMGGGDGGGLNVSELRDGSTRCSL